MATKLDDLYGINGGTPPQTDVNGTGARDLSVRATPEAFGAGVGEAVNKLGSVAGEVVNRAYGMQMETAGVNGETALIQKLASRRADYLSQPPAVQAAGLAAYQAGVQQDYQDVRANTPAGAHHMFDMLGMRQVSSYTSEGITAGVSAIKTSQQDAWANGYRAQLGQAATTGDPSEAIAVGKIAAQNKIADHPGVAQDPDTGMYSFKSDSSGDDARTLYQKYVDDSRGEAVSTVVKAQAQTDPLKASDTYSIYKDSLTPQHQAAISSYLAPRVTDAYVQSGVNQTMVNAQARYQQELANPKSQDPLEDFKNSIFAQESTSGTNPNMNSNIRGPKDAVGPMQITPDTWSTWKNLGIVKDGENITNPQQNKEVGFRAIDYYSGLPQCKKPDGSVDLARVAVAYQSGLGNVAPQGSATPYINNVQDNLGKHTADYANDVTNRISQIPVKQPNLPGMPDQTYATHMTQADSWVQNRPQMLQDARDWAEQKAPGDHTFANRIVEQTNLQINQAYEAQKEVRDTAKTKILDLINNGDGQGGKPPATYQQLYGMKGAADILQNMSGWGRENADFKDQIPKFIAEANEGNNLTNSANYGENLQRALLPNGDGNRLKDESEIHGLMSRKDDTYINVKDGQDLRGAVALDNNWKNSLRPLIDNIINANGNVDGKGQERAGIFFNRAMDMKNKAGDKAEELLNPDNALGVAQISKGYQLPRIAQISNMAKPNTQVASAAPIQAVNKLPTISSPTDPAFTALKSGESFLTPDGRTLVKH